MKLTRYIAEIAESLTPANHPEGFRDLFIALLRELVKGVRIRERRLP